MKLTVLIVLVAASTALADETVKWFSDSGKTYVRSDNSAALVVGNELSVFTDAAGTRGAGKAVVMEVTGQLARISLDEDAAKSGGKYVRLKTAPPPPPPPPPADGPPPVPPPAHGPLGGKLEPTDKGVMIRNTSDLGWSGCELKYSDRRFAPVGKVDPHQVFVIAESRLQDGPDLPYDRITVRCAEGESDFVFEQPAKKNVLQGFAESQRKGGIVVHNDGPTDWTRCDLIKPDRTHFIQGTLKARSYDTVRGGLFKEHSGPETVALTCAQGSLSAELP